MIIKHPGTLHDAREAFHKVPELSLTPFDAFVNERVEQLVNTLIEKLELDLNALDGALTGADLYAFELLRDAVWEGYMAAFQDSRLTLAELLD
jgi:hypothetical protein